MRVSRPRSTRGRKSGSRLLCQIGIPEPRRIPSSRRNGSVRSGQVYYSAEVQDHESHKGSLRHVVATPESTASSYLHLAKWDFQWLPVGILVKSRPWPRSPGGPVKPGFPNSRLFSRPKPGGNLKRPDSAPDFGGALASRSGLSQWQWHPVRVDLADHLDSGYMCFPGGLQHGSATVNR